MNRISRILTGIAVTALAIAFYLASSTPRALPTVQAASLQGTATVFGTVDSSRPFKGAKVYFRLPEKRMLYMVYTVAGHYTAMQLFPGNYEVSVQAKGLDSDVTKLTLKAGQHATLNLSLHESTASDLRKDVTYQTFDEIYPPGPGRDVAMRTCVYCHGQDFLPNKHMDSRQWNEALDYMAGKNNRQGAMIQPKELTDQNRKDLLEYLVKNFGSNSMARAVKVEVDLPVDESKVAKAEYIEYYFPTDPPGQGVNDPKYKTAGFAGGRRMGQDPQVDPDGNIWVTDRGTPNRIVKLDPRTGEMKEWLTPEPKAGVHDLEIDRRNNLVWLPENEGVPEGNLQLRAFNIKTEKWEQAYLMDPNKVIPEGTLKHAQSLTLDSHGNIYNVFILGGGLGKWDRETHKMSTWLLPTANAFPYGIVTDKYDNIWTAEFHGSKLARLEPKTGKITEYDPPTQPVLMRRLNVDSDGVRIWSGYFSGGKLIRLDPTTGKFTEWKIPHQVSQPYDFQPDNGTIWFSDAGQGGCIINFNPKTETFTYFPGPQRADMPKIRLTREGGIWYSPRSSQRYPGLGVLYPDITKITTLAAYPR